MRPPENERRRHRAHHFATTSGTGQQQQPLQAYHGERQPSTGCPICHRTIAVPYIVSRQGLRHMHCLTAERQVAA